MNQLLQIAPWKVYLWLLAPLIAMLILTNLPIGEATIHYQYNRHFYTIFGILGVLLIFSYQYIVGLAFFKERQMSAWFFKINGFIPVVFYLLFFLFSLYGFSVFLDKRDLLVGRDIVKLKVVKSGITYSLFQLFFLHSIITLFMNNRQVRKSISKTVDTEQRTRYLFIYLKPMKTVSWALIAGFLFILAYTIFLDFAF